MSRFFLWLKLYYQHVCNAMSANRWARKHGISLSLTEKLDLMKWISFKRFNSFPKITWIKDKN